MSLQLGSAEASARRIVTGDEVDHAVKLDSMAGRVDDPDIRALGSTPERRQCGKQLAPTVSAALIDREPMSSQHVRDPPLVVSSTAQRRNRSQTRVVGHDQDERSPRLAGLLGVLDKAPFGQSDITEPLDGLDPQALRQGESPQSGFQGPKTNLRVARAVDQGTGEWITALIVRIEGAAPGSCRKDQQGRALRQHSCFQPLPRGVASFGLRQLRMRRTR